MKTLAVTVSLVGGLLLAASPAHATPTTNFWAPSTPAIQGYGVLHVGDDTYFATDALYPVDLGLTMGVIPSSKVQAEIGVDALYPTLANMKGLAAPIYLNAKIGTPEDAFFHHQPSVAVGIYNLGFKSDVTTYDMLTAMIGKTMPIGMISVGGYYGLSKTLLVDPMGKPEQLGAMVGYSSPNIHVPKLDHLQVIADVQTGRNAFGGGGVGLDIYFTPAIGLLTGPIVFEEPALQPGGNRWMCSAQLDVDLDLGLARK
jgi:hypothetical protein